MDLGYKFTKDGDEFDVKPEHLTKGSSVLVEVQCDYCGKVFSRQWQEYLKKHKELEKDACSNSNCYEIKANEILSAKYGDNYLWSQNHVEKRKNTNLKKYGCINPFSNQMIQEKIHKTNIAKYGVPIPTQNSEIFAKTVATNLKKYGEVNYGVIYSREHKKELSPTWKGGAEYHRVERSTDEYRQWRKAVFDRDLYTCQCCGDKNGYGHKVELHAHHLHNWKDNKEIRYEISNGVTLCDKCHYLFHSVYGKKNNTAEQYYDFIKNTDKNIC